MAGLKRVNDITTVPYNVRVLVFHNTTSRPLVLALHIFYIIRCIMAMLQPQIKLSLIADMDHSSFIFLAEVRTRLSFGKILPSLRL